MCIPFAQPATRWAYSNVVPSQVRLVLRRGEQITLCCWDLCLEGYSNVEDLRDLHDLQGVKTGEQTWWRTIHLETHQNGDQNSSLVCAEACIPESSIVLHVWVGQIKSETVMEWKENVVLSQTGGCPHVDEHNKIGNISHTWGDSSSSSHSNDIVRL